MFKTSAEESVEGRFFRYTLKKWPQLYEIYYGILLPAPLTDHLFGLYVINAYIGTASLIIMWSKEMVLDSVADPVAKSF